MVKLAHALVEDDGGDEKVPQGVSISWRMNSGVKEVNGLRFIEIKMILIFIAI